MANGMDAWKPRRQRKKGVYYRVEVYDQTSLCWRDAPGSFDSEKDARSYILEELKNRKARVMSIDGKKRSIIE
ncbi:hypothetical protein GS636_06880 [Ruegeria sp. HKCCD4884]|uniref:hypothetical protein n=1 Tax=Ruegeria sp. HKCCD4884 TaxID=2683022 RepID=UPI00149173BD|nr:hypothetical protein [Ruegeria sp. HKCCD4884]NOD92505.1 hypothetical protein [Ruegeria sp. HKCCD4884]